MAAAYAEVGDFKKAVDWEKKALDLSKDVPEEILRETRTRLKLYEQGKPYRVNVSSLQPRIEKKNQTPEVEDLESPIIRKK